MKMRSMRFPWPATGGSAVFLLFLASGCSSPGVPVPDIPERDQAPDNLLVAESETGVVEVVTEEPLASEPPVVPPADMPLAQAGRRHVLRKGDTLMGLARSYYGNASRWRDILEANRDRIDDPDRIFVGQELVIPE